MKMKIIAYLVVLSVGNVLFGAAAPAASHYTDVFMTEEPIIRLENKTDWPLRITYIEGEGLALVQTSRMLSEAKPGDTVVKEIAPHATLEIPLATPTITSIEALYQTGVAVALGRSAMRGIANVAWLSGLAPKGYSEALHGNYKPPIALVGTDAALRSANAWLASLRDAFIQNPSRMVPATLDITVFKDHLVLRRGLAHKKIATKTQPIAVYASSSAAPAASLAAPEEAGFPLGGSAKAEGTAAEVPSFEEQHRKLLAIYDNKAPESINAEFEGPYMLDQCIAKIVQRAELIEPQEASGTRYLHLRITFNQRLVMASDLFKNVLQSIRRKLAAQAHAHLITLELINAPDIVEGTFVNFDDLISLVITPAPQGSGSYQIEPGALRSLTHLESFALEGGQNLINIRPNTFVGLGHLKNLSLAGIAQEHLQPGIFNGLENVQRLKLATGIFMPYGVHRKSFDFSSLAARGQVLFQNMPKLRVLTLVVVGRVQEEALQALKVILTPLLPGVQIRLTKAVMTPAKKKLD